ncbi:MAG: cell division protein FtsA [Flavobacteriaceae bacterium]|nr:MAG: cell division protein FtsA [Flavobacteriaceae bacterium]
MENNKDIAVGLDIGTTKIVVMVGKKNEHGKLEIIGMGKAKSQGVSRGVVSNITQTINSISEAVAQAESQCGMKIQDVTVGIAGQHIRSLQHSDYITRTNYEEVIGPEDVKRLVNQVHKLSMMPGEEIIHVLPQEFKIDSQSDVREPIGMYGRRLEANFHVVVGQISSIKNIARCIKSAGLNLTGITLEPIASSVASLSMEEKEAGVALIDIGGGTTDIAIFKDNVIRHTAVIPFGGNIITEDVKEGCSIIERQAELLKTKFGSAWPGENKETEIVSIAGLRGREPKEISLKKLSQIIHARIEEVLQQAYLEMKNYGCDEQKKKLIAGIVMTGGGSKLKHIRQLTEFVTGMDVRIGYSNEHLAGGQSEELANPEYATGIGLLMKALEKLEDDKTIGGTFENLQNKEKVTQINPTGLLEEPVNVPTTQEVLQEMEISPEVEAVKEEVGKKRSKSFLNHWSEKFIQMLKEEE